MSQIHKCGVCTKEFKTEDAYLNHKCSVTSHKPTEIEHQDALTNGKASKVAEKAIERGEARKSA